MLSLTDSIRRFSRRRPDGVYQVCDQHSSRVLWRMFLAPFLPRFDEARDLHPGPLSPSRYAPGRWRDLSPLGYRRARVRPARTMLREHARERKQRRSERRIAHRKLLPRPSLKVDAGTLTQIDRCLRWCGSATISEGINAKRAGKRLRDRHCGLHKPNSAAKICPFLPTFFIQDNSTRLFHTQ